MAVFFAKRLLKRNIAIRMEKRLRSNSLINSIYAMLNVANRAKHLEGLVHELQEVLVLRKISNA